MGRGRHGHSRRHARRRSRSGRRAAALERELKGLRGVCGPLAIEAAELRGQRDMLAERAGYREPLGVRARVAEAARVLVGRRATVKVGGVRADDRALARGLAASARWAAVEGAGA